MSFSGMVYIYIDIYIYVYIYIYTLFSKVGGSITTMPPRKHPVFSCRREKKTEKGRERRP